MSDALNGSVAPFCHSQDRPGGVPVAVFDQPAGLTGESAFVQHQPLGSRKKKDGFELDKDKHGNERCATAEKQSGSDAADVNEGDIVAYIREDDGVVGYLLTDDGQGGFEVVTSNAHLQDN